MQNNNKERIVSYELTRRITPCPKPKTSPRSPAPSAPARHTPKDTAKKTPSNRSSRTGAAEKKRPSRISELESRVSQLQAELKKAKDQLISFQSHTAFEQSGIGRQSDDSGRLNQREEELEAELRSRTSEIEELKADLMDKETELQCVLSENDNLQTKLEKKNQTNLKELELENEVKRLKETVVALKAKLMDKETEVQCIAEENETLRFEICKKKGYPKVNNDRSGPLEFPYDALCGKIGSCRIEGWEDDGLPRKKTGKRLGVLWRKYKK